MSAAGTSDSAALIAARGDDDVWSRMLPALEKGGRCRRIPERGGTFCIAAGEPSEGPLSDARLRLLLKRGVLIRIEPGLYRLEDAGEDAA